MARTIRLDIVVDDHGAVTKLKAVEKEIDDVNRKAGPASQSLGGMDSALLSMAKRAAGIISVGAAFRWVAQTSIGMNASLETSTLQFQTLMGSAVVAREHVRGLFEFAAKTPFETGPIIEASRQLEAFGGAALNNTAILTALGNSSAATGAGFEILAFWVGRMYSNLQSGKPFGEAALRLQELTVLTPQARQELEDMQAAGKDGQEIFEVFAESLGRFTGAMELQAQTWKGLTSTLTEQVGLAVADQTRGLFELAKMALRVGTETDAMTGTMIALRNANIPVIGQFLQLAEHANLWADAQQTVTAAVGGTSAAAAALMRELAPLTAQIQQLTGIIGPLGGPQLGPGPAQMQVPLNLMPPGPAAVNVPLNLTPGGGGFIFDANNQMVGMPFYGLPRAMWPGATSAPARPGVSNPFGPSGTAAPMVMPMGFGRGGGGQTIMNIQININAQGSFFEEERALRRLADKIAQAFGDANRLGAMTPVGG